MEIPRGCELAAPNPFSLLIFGATGDLAQKKLLPALYQLGFHSLLPEQFFILGAARRKLSVERFREETRAAVQSAFPAEFEEQKWRMLAEKIHYSPIEDNLVSSCNSLLSDCATLEKKFGTRQNRLFYLAVPPAAFEPLISGIGESGLKREGSGYTHIVIEKPHGHDFESARRLTGLLGRYFRQDQIYFMDHYLAKETVQNILMFRFANSIFEPLWNNRFIDHIQITVAETVGIEKRSQYYERAGVLRDMFQNHLLQLLTLIAMEPPSVFEAEKVRDEKAKVLASVKPFPLAQGIINDWAVVGQYGPGTVDGRQVAGYRDEPGVSPASTVATYAALKVMVDNWRWNGVPFYLRSGKRLARRRAGISVHFRPAPHLMFAGALEGNILPNTLTLRIQPHEGIDLFFQTKLPGSRLCLNPVIMDFSYPEPFALDDYARILLDAMQADQMLFVRADAVEKSWELLTPLIDKIESGVSLKDFPNYAAGSAGPAAADALLAKDGRKWNPL